MENKSAIRAFLPLTIIFVITSGLFIALREQFDSWKIDTNVMIIGNIIIFAATLFSFALYLKGLKHQSNAGFLRMVYSGMFVKLMVCMFTAVIYILVYRKGVSKGAIFACMFLYFLYTFVEVAILMKRSKEQKNA